MSEHYGIRLAVLDGHETLLDVAVDEPCALFGSGSHCDIQVGPAQAAYEHLLVELRAGGVFVEVLATKPPVTVDGAPFQGGRVLEGSCLAVGKLSLRIVAEQRHGSHEKPAAGPLGKGALLLFAVVAVMGVIGVMGLRRSPKVDEQPAAPALFTDVGDARCPETTSEAARIAAREFLTQAEAQHERAFFEVSDAVRAVFSYRQAAACLEVAGDPGEARRVLQTKERFAQDAARVYHLHQVRLYRAIALGDHEGARVSVDALIAYLANSNDPYVAWLDGQRRNLHAKLGANHGPKK